MAEPIFVRSSPFDPLPVLGFFPPPLPEWGNWVMHVSRNSDNSWRVKMSYEPDVEMYGDGRDDLYFAEGD